MTIVIITLDLIIVIIIIIINEFHRDASLTKTSGPLILSKNHMQKNMLACMH